MRYFGSWLSRGCLAAVLLAGNAHAGTPFLDNFQQFPPGTLLSPTNYVPFVGASVAITNLDGTANPTAVVATNFSGSTQALFGPGTLPYSEDYLGFPAVAQTNPVVTLSFTLLIPAVQTVGHFGGFDVSLPMTGGGDNPLLLFNDDGGVLVFTNQASTTPLVLPFVQIGSWSGLQNTVMTNVLVLDYSAGTYSFSLNGAVLTNNMPIPGYFTNLFDAVRVEAFESVTNAGVASLGNSFALGNVQVSVPPSSTNQDVSQYTPAAKGQLFDQHTSGAPTLSATGFLFQTSVTGTGSNTILGASVQAPGGSNIVLSLSEPETSKFKFQALFIDQPSMDAVFTNGNYLMAIGTADDGTLTPALTVTGDAYPNAPQVLNFDAAQAIDISTNFVFAWGSFTNGTTADVISFEIDDGSGNTITNTPDLGQPGQLDGTATNFTIAAGMLTAGTTNTGHIEFIKVTASDTNSVPGALGVAGYFAETRFSIVVGTSVCVFAISPTNATFDATGGSGGINITAPNGCAWTATNNDSFITIDSGSSGSGNGTVGYTIAANLSSDQLTGTITVAGQTFIVFQTGVACNFSLDLTNASYGSTGGSSNVVVTASGTNCAWTAVSNSGFITINSGASGSGNGIVSYTVATNANAIDQTGSLTIAGQTYTITQAAAACAFTLNFTNANLTADGASGDITFTANGTNCAWTAVSNDSFITITNGPSGTSGTGNGTVTVTVATNTDTVARTGTLTIAGQTFTITEDAAACIVTIDSTAANFPAAGGSSNVAVTANGTNCDWIAASNSGSITITDGTNGLGNGTVSYTVAANTGTARTVTMTIADQTFTVHQAGATLDFALTNVAQTCKTRIVKRTSTTNTTCAVNFNLAVSNTGVANTPAFYVLIWLKQGSVFNQNVGVVFLAKRVRALRTGKSTTFRIRKSGINGDQAGTFLFVTDTANNVLASAEIPSP